MYKIGIIGLGFMGGCLAKTLIKSKKIEEICAFDKNKEFLQTAFNEGNITRIANELADFKDSDIIFLCTPVGLISEFAKKLKDIIKNDCIITDIGSTKCTIIDEIKEIAINFVGGHPMVGSERTGYNTSNDYLFENAYYILIENDNKTSITIMQEIIKELKAIPVLLDSKSHDYVMATISHVPHVIAAALVNLVKELDTNDEKMKLLAAGGFKDITRIASADPIMWEHICKENEDEIVLVLEKYINNLKYRDSFAIKRINGQTNPTINVSIKDEKGSIASIATLLAKNDINIRNIGIENNRENMSGALYIVFEGYEEKEKGFKILKENNYEVKSS